jgi:hypothetical protein
MSGGSYSNKQSWRISFRLCKLLFLQHKCDVNEQDFFSPLRDQNIQRKKNVTMLYVW